MGGTLTSSVRFCHVDVQYDRHFSVRFSWCLLRWVVRGRSGVGPFSGVRLERVGVVGVAVGTLLGPERAGVAGRRGPTPVRVLSLRGGDAGGGGVRGVCGVLLHLFGPILVSNRRRQHELHRLPQGGPGLQGVVLLVGGTVLDRIRPYLENCTVDASIFVAKLVRAHGGCLGTRSR